MELVLFKITLIIYLSAAGLFFAGRRLMILPILGLTIHVTAIVIYSLKAGRPPFTNLYESLLFFSALIILVWLISLFNFQLQEAGGYLLLLVSLGLGYTVLYPSSAKPLMPALRSFWLHIHVVTCFLSYTFFTLAAASGLIFLIKKEETGFRAISNFIRAGFSLLTMGIITGSIWAYFAWGRYWGWDPKEVWALITWLYYSLFFHLRLVGVGKKAQAYLAIIGLVVILFTFLGVSFLLPGLHSYL